MLWSWQYGRCTLWARWCTPRQSSLRWHCGNYFQILASADILVSFTYICLSTLLVEVINGEWREARQMSGIPVAFSYFKVLIFSSYIGSHLCNWLSWFIVRRCCLILAKYFAKFPVTKRGVLLAGKADSVNTEVPFHWLPLTILTEWTNRPTSFRLEESPPTASTAEFLQVGLSSPYYHPLQTHLSF